MKLRAFAAISLAFGPLAFALPAHAETFQFTYYWTAREFTFADQTVTVTVTNNITNKIGGNGEVIDTYRITLGDQVIEVTEKHDARTYTFAIQGTQTLRLEGIDRGFWAGNYGPIMTVSASQPQPVIEPPIVVPEISVSPEISESPVVTEAPVVVPQPVTPPPPTATETKEIAESVIDDYAAFWAKYRLNEADYSQDSRVQTYRWIRAQYDQLIAERKISKSLTSALAMRSQVAVIEAAYLAGDLKRNPVPVIKPKPTPTPEPTPEPTLEPKPEPKPTAEPQPTPEPSATVKPEPSPEPTPEPQPSPKPEPQPTPSPEPSPQPTQPAPSPDPTPSVSPSVEPKPEPVATSSPQPKPRPTLPVVSSSPEPTVSPAPLLPKPEPTKPQPSVTPISPVVTLSPITESPSESEEVETPTSTSSEVIEVPEETQSDTVSATAPIIGAVSEAIGQLVDTFATAGLDMSPEKREEAQEIVISTIIVSQVASAASVAVRKVK